MRLSFFLYALLFLFPTSSYSIDTYNEALETRLNKLYEDVRCPSCHGQSIKDSNAEMAKVLREHIKREALLNKTDAEIISKLKTKFGDGIINSISFNLSTAMLWLIPLLFGLMLFKMGRKLI